MQTLAADEAVRLVVNPVGDDMPVRLRINVDRDKMPAGLVPGATIRLRAWIMPPAPMAVPGGYAPPGFSRSVAPAARSTWR